LNSARKAATTAAVSALNRALPRAIRNTVSIPIDDKPIAIPTFVDAAKEFRQNFYDRQGGLTGARLRSKYFSERNIGVNDTEEDPSIVPFKTVKSKETQLKDPYNIAPFALTTEQNKISYRNIIKEREDGTDIIKFIFRDSDDSNPVYFRALLSSIKENVKPEFMEQRYVGRTERFVTYSGAKRGLSLSFNIVAFSPGEADGMWTKVNYLTGLAFPKGVKNGFMVPPLFKMTIGGLYENQPCYIETLDYDFLDETITFDTNREVPFAINVNMQLSILEKRSKFHDSPFYKITEAAAQTAIERQRAVDTLTQILRQG
jgi:hypothetical protein